MPISLQKGQKVDLTKTNPGLTKICIGLGWDVNKYDGGSAFDLDTAAFLLGENGKVREQGDFVFYGNKSSVIKQIGNAVPPLLAYYLANVIKNVEEGKYDE